jgi:N-acetylglucosamine kinase-like BadF-type ATPase
LRVGDRVVDVEGPGANVATLEHRLVDERLSALLARLGEARPDACCAGAAGAEVPAAGGRLRELLERRLPGCRVSVVHDTRLALAAAGLDAGIVLIAGTGSVAYALAAGGREARRGGWGWMVGDEGSGAWIAREAARAVLARADDGLELGPLGAKLLAACRAGDAEALKANLHELRESGQWAALASTVFETEADDPAAHAIVVHAAEALAALVMPLRKLIDGPVVLAGGLLLHRPSLENAVRERLPLECVRLDQPPVEGAVRLAAALLAR